ncbi:MAG: Fe-S cluster assembly protein SufD [Bacteroidales bacterium]|nr:Fe-S cluster assembly protein SufD [Bacteroidales bacterium]
MTTSISQYLDLYRQHGDAIRNHAPAAMNALRDAALAALEGATLPKKGQEDYEATDLEQAIAPDYGVNINRVPFAPDAAASFRCDVPNMSTCLYFFFNDIFAASRTAARNTQPGLVIESFAEAQKNHPEVLEQYLGSLADVKKPEVALNTLLAQDGMLIYVPKGMVVEKPIQLVNILNASAPVMALRRILVVMEEDAQAKMLVCDHTQDAERQYLASQVIEIVAKRGAMFDYYDLEESSDRTHRVSSVFVSQEEGSNVLIDGITLLNGFTRNDCYVDLNGEHAETHLLGMTVASAHQHVDNHTFISHNVARCQSNEMFKYVLNDSAVGAFAGKVLVKENCPRTVAYQGNRNIVASTDARMHSKPQLEIYTDDVKCSHGSATGQLDEEALFYMRSRGISEAEARQLLMQAFMADVIDAVRLPALKDRLHHLVEKRFRGQLAMCAECGATSCGSKIDNA